MQITGNLFAHVYRAESSVHMDLRGPPLISCNFEPLVNFEAHFGP